MSREVRPRPLPASAGEMALVIVFMFGVATVAALLYTLVASVVGVIVGLTTGQVTTHLLAAACGALFGVGYTLFKLEDEN